MILYLASHSPRRRELLARVGIPFKIVERSEVSDDGLSKDAPAEYAVGLALRKALAADIDDGLVIGADTIVILKGEIIGKPQDKNDAKEILQKLSGKWHTVVTGIALVDKSSGEQKTAFEATQVLFSELADDEIDAYIATGEPMDKAGAYGIQEKGALLVRRVEGCFYNVVGLPQFLLTELLKSFNIDRKELISEGI